MNNSNQNTIIVYRSRVEQQQDEFIQNNPEFVLGFIGVLIIVVLIYKFKK